MSQKSRPWGDLTVSEWSPVPLYAQINEISPDDSRFISGVYPYPGAPEVYFRIKMSSIGTPPPRSHKFRIRLRKSGDGSFAIFLFQQGTFIAARSFTDLTTGFVTREFELTNEEISRITDYSELIITSGG